ncbi:MULTISPECIES: DUF6343 family protein [unclassified Streptomyces]|uniref:DUF6343 family protein n=1 Tax=unclassified Streptomyces TaxID=2593676 RepID=UPI003867C1F0
MRTGNEPVTARSPLRMRWWLSVWGLFWTAFGTVAFAIADRPGWAIGCGVLLLLVATDFMLIVRHMRQGSRFQPGRDVPPYEVHQYDSDDRDGPDTDSYEDGGGDKRRDDDNINVSRRSRNARLRGTRAWGRAPPPA